MPNSLQKDLANRVCGDVRFDRLARTLYSTDASIYEIVPAGVVCPRDLQDVVATVEVCRAHATPIVARGAGTGLAGGAVGSGVQIDFSRYMHGVGELNLDKGTVRVQPGVVLDALNAFLAPHGAHFAPDVATSSRATIGGMIANNSCGAHSVIYGRTVDHVAALTVVLADGSVTTWPSTAGAGEGRGSAIERELSRIVDTYREEVVARFPKVLRRNGGYGLDSLCASGEPVDPTRIVCGSEGTLCLVAEAVLKVTPLPKCRSLLLVRFDALLDAFSATPSLLLNGPAAVELVDRLVLAGAARDASADRYCELVDLGAEALLMVEFFGAQQVEVDTRIEETQRVLASSGIDHSTRVIRDPQRQNAVWEMRKRGLGLLMSSPGDVQSCAFVEDTAVDPSRLRDYMERFQSILAEEGVRDTAYYAHASVGEIHVRPALNLKTAEGVVQMHRIADRVSDLALEFGGAMTGEHGDGIVRSCWIEKMYGPTIATAFAEVKRAFDPEGLMNPGKIVEPLEMTEHLRYGPEYSVESVKTHTDYRAHGGFTGVSEMCSGIGQCRQRQSGTMCPSFVATGDETHTTRARANALRVAMSNRGLLDGLSDPALDEVMDLCLMCKACKSECPTGVDMAALKSDWLSHRNMRLGVSRGARFAADTPRVARILSRVPRLANILGRSSLVRGLLERRYGLDRRITPPRLATTTFRKWFDHHRKQRARTDGPVVAYLVDTWTNYYTPSVGVAATRVLEAAGFRVVVPRFECCGRTKISKGLLGEAKHLAENNIRRFAPFADTRTPIVGTEPSCVLTLCDEYPRLVPTDDARAVAGIARTIESFLDEVLQVDPGRVRFNERRQRILYHAHCHQKALVGTASAMRLLAKPPGYQVEEIGAGCCGMAGAFGHEVGHYEVARAIGSERLFPAVRDRADAEIAVSGFSCRQQIAHHTGVEAVHVIELLARALDVR